jgi:hypothetical protein
LEIESCFLFRSVWTKILLFYTSYCQGDERYMPPHLTFPLRWGLMNVFVWAGLELWPSWSQHPKCFRWQVWATRSWFSISFCHKGWKGICLHINPLSSSSFCPANLFPNGQLVTRLPDFFPSLLRGHFGGIFLAHSIQNYSLTPTSTGLPDLFISAEFLPSLHLSFIYLTCESLPFP